MQIQLLSERPPEKEISPIAMGDQGSAFGNRKPFEKGLTENFYTLPTPKRNSRLLTGCSVFFSFLQHARILLGERIVSKIRK